MYLREVSVLVLKSHLVSEQEQVCFEVYRGLEMKGKSNEKRYSLLK